MTIRRISRPHGVPVIPLRPSRSLTSDAHKAIDAIRNELESKRVYRDGVPLASFDSDDLTGPIALPLPVAPSTTQPSPKTVAWLRAQPLTIGLLIAIVAAIVWGASQIHALDDRRRADHGRIISAHDVNEGAHPGLRKAVEKLSRRIDILDREAQQRHIELMREIAKRRRTRRNRR